MRSIHRFTIATAFLTIAGIIGMATTTRSVAAANTPDAGIGRVRAHLDTVLVDLASRPATELSVQQIARRGALIRALRDYRDRGVFPHNYDFPGRAVPYFVDRKTGALCAVANLLAYSGRWDIVDRVAHADNNVWVAQLAGDTAFVRWLDANGLTLAEAAHVQLPYTQNQSASALDSRNLIFSTVAPVTFGGSVLSSAWNAWGNSDGHRRSGNVLGVVSGALSLAVAATSVGRRDVPVAVTATTAAIGGMSIALGTRGIVRQRQIANAKHEEERARLASVSLAPIVSANGGAGISVALRF